MATTFLDIKGRNLVLSGDLTVNGTTTTIESGTVTVNDVNLKLADGNTGNTFDTGVYFEYDTATTAKYSGYFRDVSNSDKFTFYKDLEVEPGSTVNTADPSFAYATIVAEAFEGTNVRVDTTDGTIDTSSGDLTLSATSNSDVLVNPSGTGQVKFYTNATNNGYSFPIDAGPGEDGYALLYDDATDALVWTDPAAFANANSVTSQTTLTTAGSIIVTEPGADDGDRDVVESGVIIDASDNITGINDLTVTSSVNTPLLTNAGNLTIDTSANGDIILDPDGTGQIKANNCLIYHGANNTTSDACDLGWFGVYDPTGSGDRYAGIFRDASDSGKFKIFSGLQVEPTGDLVNTAGAGFGLATLAVDALEAGNINIDVTAGVIDTASGTLTISAATNNNVIIDPDGTGVINFYSAYSFPPADGAANTVLTTDGAGNVTFVDPTTLVGADHVTASAVFPTANRLVKTENGGDREVVETDIVITGTDVISGISTITADQLLPGCATQSSNVVLAATDPQIQAVTTGASTITITLPTNPPCGTMFRIIKADAGAGDVSISRGGTNTISDGVTTSLTLTDQYDQTKLIFEDTTGTWYFL